MLGAHLEHHLICSIILSVGCSTKISGKASRPCKLSSIRKPDLCAVGRLTTSLATRRGVARTPRRCHELRRLARPVPNRRPLPWLRNVRAVAARSSRSRDGPAVAQGARIACHVAAASMPIGGAAPGPALAWIARTSRPAGARWRCATIGVHEAPVARDAHAGSRRADHAYARRPCDPWRATYEDAQVADQVPDRSPRGRGR